MAESAACAYQKQIADGTAKRLKPMTVFASNNSSSCGCSRTMQGIVMGAKL